MFQFIFSLEGNSVVPIQLFKEFLAINILETSFAHVQPAPFVVMPLTLGVRGIR